MASAAEITVSLNRYQQKALRRTKDGWGPAPDVNWRYVGIRTMRILRDRYELVEDGFGRWRRTDLGREVVSELEKS